jgi:hypothetical protein
MIVRHTAAGWEIIYQGAHALLAGNFARHLKRLAELRFGLETSSAIVDHDDLKEPFGKNVYLTDLGAPRDFTQFTFTARERLAEAKRRIESGHRKHRWMGLLASQHVEALYGGERLSKGLSALLLAERKRRSKVLSDLATPQDELEAAYEFMGWCDRASLILCQNALPAMHRRLEISSLGDDARSEIWLGEDQAVHVAPWPFVEDRFTVGCEVRLVQKLHFTNDRELERALLAAEIENREWRFARFEK